MTSQPWSPMFPLEALHQHGPLLIANQTVYVRSGQPPSWLRVGSLGSLEELDMVHGRIPAAPPLQEVANYQRDAESVFTSLMPDAARAYTRAIMIFCVQAERFRMGKTAAPFVPSAPVRRPDPPVQLAGLLGAPVVLMYKGILFVPRAPLNNPLVQVAVREEDFLPIVQPGSLITMDQLKQSYAAIMDSGKKGEVEPIQSLGDDMEVATVAVERTLAQQSTRLGCRVIYDCPDTGLAALVRSSGQPMLTVSSGPFAVEDTSGSVYQFDGFTLAVFPDASANQVMATPYVVDPPAFRHWHPNQLHMCTYQPERPVSNPLQMDNCVSLLLSGRHMLRAGLFGAPGGGGGSLGPAFADRKISREEAERLGLPIYPFLRALPGTVPSPNRRRPSPTRAVGLEEMRQMVEMMRRQAEERRRT